MEILHGSGLLYIHTYLYRYFGDPEWWPGDTPFEVALGAILTQNTSWSNVERAVEKLKENDMISPRSILEDEAILPDLIRSAGYYNRKSDYIAGLCRYLIEGYDGRIDNMSSVETSSLRIELLSLRGIGKETADSILCYSLNRPVFVVDAYTRSIFRRMDPDNFSILSDGAGDDYDRIQGYVEDILGGDHLMLNRFHALLVCLGKDLCRAEPLCKSCPLGAVCMTGTAGK